MNLVIPVIQADGTPVQDFQGYTDWRQNIKTTEEMEPFDFSGMAEERHRAVYARVAPSATVWVAGDQNFRDLLTLGLRPSDRFLDLGCGPGRVGVHLIPYLDEGCYFGVDIHKHGLIAFSAYEVPKYGLADKRPSLMLDNAFRVEAFGVKFDVVADCMTIPFLKNHEFVPAMANLRKSCHAGTRLLSRWNESPMWDKLEEAGWRHEGIETVSTTRWRQEGIESAKTRWRVIRPIDLS